MAASKGGVLALVSGALFGAGVCLSGMVRPSKVLGFLDLRGHWDPSLAVVMATAIALHAVAWAVVRRLRAPLFGGRFPGPASDRIDRRLVGGAALFGLGWGLGGFCPGPAMVSTVSGATGALVFFASMTFGMLAHQLFDRGARSRGDASGVAVR